MRYNKPKVSVVVLARIDSKRLPQKAIEKIGHKTTLDILLERVKMINDVDVILAIPGSVENDCLEQIGLAHNVKIYRGEDDSPLHRMAGVIENEGPDHIVRVTHDDILIDPLLTERQLSFHLKGNSDYTYIAKCPSGTTGEVIRSDVILEVAEETEGKSIEYPCYWIKKGNRYQIKEFYPPYEHQYNFRCTMDYQQDLDLIKILFASLAEPFYTLDIINFLKKHTPIQKVNKMPKITFYTCNYNTGDYIVECMKSVMSQDCNDFEYIVVDDHSTDCSIEKITEYVGQLPYQDQEKIRVIRNEKNLGLPASCNKVLDIARGKYIMRIDSDDKIMPNIVEEMLQNIGSSAVVFSGYKLIDSKGKEIGEERENKEHPGCCLLNTFCVKEVKFKEGLEHFEGNEFFKRFKEAYKTSFVEWPLWYYRRHEKQKSDEKNAAVRAKLIKEVLA